MAGRLRHRRCSTSGFVCQVKQQQEAPRWQVVQGLLQAALELELAVRKQVHHYDRARPQVGAGNLHAPMSSVRRQLTVPSSGRPGKHLHATVAVSAWQTSAAAAVAAAVCALASSRPRTPAAETGGCNGASTTAALPPELHCVLLKLTGCVRCDLYR